MCYLLSAILLLAVPPRAFALMWDFDEGTTWGWTAHESYFWYWNTAGCFELSPNYLESIQVDGHIVGVYSQKFYAELWAGEAVRIRESDRAANFIGRFDTGADELSVYNLGVNIVVYALTREGSLARQLIAAD
ncbi:MAG: hypothetical protein OXI72_13350 [Gemmatimonadota bacterium]|nr:hypothetical protein [Gemmatimonadota bacterium]